MSAENPKHSGSASIADQAAQWLVRRDRGLTAAEQDEYLQWLREDARHAAAIARHEKTVRRMTQLATWQPTRSNEPNPDLFAPPRRWSRPVWLGSLAAAAAIVVAVVSWWQPSPPPAATITQKSYLRLNQRQLLPDGSIAELKDGSSIAVAFSPRERRVRLTGEAHFTVAKSAERPFVVEAGGVAVRAIGTAFNVRVGNDAIDVLVTEGIVRVTPAPKSAVREEGVVPAVNAPFELTAGQRAVVAIAEDNGPRRSDVSPAAMKDALAWREPRLQFVETPLAIAVEEFNRHSSVRLVLGQPDLGAMLIGGTFRVGNVEGFVRVLEITLDIRGETRGDEIVLTRSR